MHGAWLRFRTAGTVSGVAMLNLIHNSRIVAVASVWCIVFYHLLPWYTRRCIACVLERMMTGCCSSHSLALYQG